MFMITKKFDYCYGHRVHTQTLNSELACTSQCKCRHLHGHQGEVIVKLGANKLKDGMVTDFHHLNWFKQWLDKYFDHKMILDVEDPYLYLMLENRFSFPSFSFPNLPEWDRKDYDAYSFLTPNYIEVEESLVEGSPVSEKLALSEVLEGLIVVNFIPTSENFAKFFSSVVALKLEEELSEEDQQRIWVVAVEFKETPKTSSLYSGGM